MSKKKLPDKPVVIEKKKKPKVSAWESLEGFLNRRETVIEIILFALFVLFALLLFDVKISIGGDDSAYIERGYNFIRHGEITFYQGPFYPCVLGVFIGIFGINITALKLTSFFFVCLQQVILFLALRKRVPKIILFFLLLFIATNYYLQYYSSETYTEALFLCLQSLSLYFTFKLLDREDENLSLKKNYRLWLVIGFMMLILSLCKSVAIVCFLPLIIYFAVKKKWLPAALSFGSFLLWKIVYEISMRVFYKAPDIGQFKQILLKNLYKPEYGYEDLPGMFTRFVTNLHTYFSCQLFRLLQLQDELNFDMSPLLSYVVALLLIACTVYLYRKNKYLFFTSVYMLILYGGIFIGIQAANMQLRLIIIVLPLTYLILISSGYYLSRSYRKAGIAIVLFFVGLMFYQLSNIMTMSDKHFPVLRRNLQGDLYYGYGDDWVNYLKMSRWCADSLPQESLVACRKAAMSFIYGRGKRFYEINIVGVTDPDSVLAELKHDKVTHFIIAPLRQDPGKNDGKFITTLHKKFFHVHEKYPEKIKLIKSIGISEPADLYQILY